MKMTTQTMERLKTLPLVPEYFHIKNAVGVEIECLSQRRPTLDEIPHWARWGGDSTIEAPTTDYNTAEFRLLMSKNRVKSHINKFCEMLEKYGYTANQSCGLHVHLDMRKVDYFKAYIISKKLNFWLRILKNLLPQNRRENRWCNLKFKKTQKYSAVNFSSYAHRRTIEVRMHHGTTKSQEILAWISLLNTIIQHGKRPVSRDCLEALNELPLKDSAKEYWKKQYTLNN